MNKKVLKAAAVGAISVVAAGVIAAKVGADQTKLPLLADDIPVSYSLTLSSSHDLDGENKLLTDLQNPISFAVSDATTEASEWRTLAAGGYFENADAISGMTSVALAGSSVDDLALTFGYESAGIYYESPIKSDVISFGDLAPSYFRISNPTDSLISIDSVSISYSCSRSFSPNSAENLSKFVFEANIK